MSIVLDGTTGIAAPALDSDGSLTLGTAVMAVPTGDAPLFGCRAWVNFDGTKDTTGAASTANTNRLIRASGNVTSVLRNGTGDYTITFTTAMPDADYAASSMGSSSSSTQLGAAWYTVGNAKTTSAFQVNTSQLSVTGSNVAIDLAHVCVTIIR